METSARLLDGRYELGPLLASGGMGRVWRGRDMVLNRAVAVKILRSEFTDDGAFLARFRAEAQHAAALHHPNIASVFDYGEVDEQGERLAYLVMELVDGESLAALLARQPRLDVATSLRVMRGTAAALAVAHSAGMVHRDVKPGNVLVAPDGAVKITDFGIAWSAASVPLTRTGQVIGTAHYLSPEQAQGGRATPASDVYALGAVTYECLAGRRVFEAENAVQVIVKHIREEPDPLPPDVPENVRALVARAMDKDPARRFPDGDSLLAAIDDVLAGGSPAGASWSATRPVAYLDSGAAGPMGTALMPLPERAPHRPAPSAPPAARRRPTALLAGAVVALLLIAAVVVWVQVFDGSDGTATAPTTSAQQTTAEQSQAPVELDADAYLGRPVAEVRAELEVLGLEVALQPVPTADVADGLVTALTPTEGLVAGSTVTVSHAVAPPAPAPAPDDEEDEDDGPGGNGNGNGNNGNGNGNGNNGPGNNGNGNGNNGNGNGRGNRN
jgi:serine/threonine-protein kinase